MQAVLTNNWSFQTPPNGFWRSGSLRWLLLTSLLLHLGVLLLPPLWTSSVVVKSPPEPLSITVVQQPPQEIETPAPVIPEAMEEVAIPTPTTRPLPTLPTPVTPTEQTSEPTTAPQQSESKTELEWVQEGRAVAEQILREEADRAARMAAQWFRAPSIMWGEVPRVFDREYVLTHFRPTGLLGDPAVLMRGKEFRGLGIPLGENCFLGLPKVDVEQQYREYNERLPSVYPEPTVANLNLYSCGFSTSGD